MVFHIFLLAGSFFSLNLVEITNPVCSNASECSTNQFKSCCLGVCSAWKHCNGSCALNTDCGVHELCVDKMCSPNTTKNLAKPSHIRVKDYLICIGFVMGLFLFQIGLPLLYIYKDKVAFCLKCKWIWNKDGSDEDDEEQPPRPMNRRWPLFGFAVPMAAQYSRLSQLDDSCSFESDLYVQSRTPEHNLRIVQQQVENVFGVPPPVYTTLTDAGEITSDADMTVSDSVQNENCEQGEGPRAVNSGTDVDDSVARQEIENSEEENLTQAEQQFNLAMSIPPPYERACFTQTDGDNSPANDVTDELGMESSLKKLYKLPSYNSINKISEAEPLPPSYDVLED